MKQLLVKFLLKLVTSEVTKLLIAMGVKKLVNHQKDGITKDVAEAMLDGIAKSRANNVPEDAFDVIKQSL